MIEKGQYKCNYCDEIFGFFYVKQVNSLVNFNIVINYFSFFPDNSLK